jgi:hypothetical protein
MLCVGEVEKHAQRICEVAQECLYKAIDIIKPGTTLGDIGEIIQVHAEGLHYGVVREYCGHGIGKIFHEDPQVMHYGKAGEGLILAEGMTFTVEPMLNAGTWKTKLNKRDGWTVTTADRRLSAQWETLTLATQRHTRSLHHSRQKANFKTRRTGDHLPKNNDATTPMADMIAVPSATEADLFFSASLILVSTDTMRSNTPALPLPLIRSSSFSVVFRMERSSDIIDSSLSSTLMISLRFFRF